MKEKEIINLPISFEYFMSTLFGKKNYHGFVGWHDKKNWKKILIKILTYIKKAIKLNLISDSYHRDKTLEICEILIKKIQQAKTIEQTNVDCLEKLFRLVFYLIGDIPQHWNNRAPYTDKFWRLNGHRTLNYVQNEEQKVSLILYLIDTQKKYQDKIKQDDFDSLTSLFYIKFKAKNNEFLNWFKKEYSEIYCDIF